MSSSFRPRRHRGVWVAPQLEHSVLVPAGVEVGATVAPGVLLVFELVLLTGGADVAWCKAIGFIVVAVGGWRERWVLEGRLGKKGAAPG